MTLSLPDVRPALQGAQLPRVSSVPPAPSTAGDDAIDLAAAAGLFLEPWQQHVLRGALGERPDGKWSAFEVGLIVPRQNGKGSVLEARELAGLFVLGEQLILHSAHDFKTAAEAFLRIRQLIEQTPDLDNKVEKVSTAHGQEGITLKSGQRLKFVARTGGSGRGFSADCIILDEAYNLPEHALGALLPTLNAKPNPQLWYTSSAVDRHNPAHQHGVVLSRLRARGLRGGDPSLAYFEWSAPDDSNHSDELAWAMGNPALGVRIPVERLAVQQRSVAPETFAVEALGIGSWFGEDSDDAALQWEPWAAGADKLGLPSDSSVSFAVDVKHDRSGASIGVAGKRPDGSWNVEIVDDRHGTSWIVPRLLELKQRYDPAAVGLDAGGPAGSLLPALKDAGLDVTQVTTREFAQACGAFHDDVVAGAVHHPDQAVLNAAVRTSRTRPMGEAWCWSRKTGVPLVAVTLARHLHALALGTPVDSRMFVF